MDEEKCLFSYLYSSRGISLCYIFTEFEVILWPLEMRFGLDFVYLFILYDISRLAILTVNNNYQDLPLQNLPSLPFVFLDLFNIFW